MTVKELKTIINNIDEKYDNEELITDDRGYTEYCMGDGYIKIEGIDCYMLEYSNKGFYISFEA